MQKPDTAVRPFVVIDSRFRVSEDRALVERVKAIKQQQRQVCGEGFSLVGAV